MIGPVAESLCNVGLVPEVLADPDTVIARALGVDRKRNQVPYMGDALIVRQAESEFHRRSHWFGVCRFSGVHDHLLNNSTP